MCSQLFTLLLLALSLTLASGKPSNNVPADTLALSDMESVTKTSIDMETISQADLQTLQETPLNAQEESPKNSSTTYQQDETSAAFDALSTDSEGKTLNDMENVINTSINMEMKSQDDFQTHLITSLNAQAQEEENHITGLQELRNRLDDFVTKNETQRLFEVFKNVIQLRLDSLETSQIYQAQVSESQTKGLQNLRNRQDYLVTKNESQRISEELKEVSKRLRVLETRIKSQEKSAKNALTSQQKDTVYILFTHSKKNWYEAFADCLERNMELASVESEEEYHEVMKQINAIEERPTNVDVWLSGKWYGNDGTFKWMSTGRQVPYNKWGSFDPSFDKDCPGGEFDYCVEINQRYDNEWANYCCSHSQFYICQIRN